MPRWYAAMVCNPLEKLERNDMEETDVGIVGLVRRRWIFPKSSLNHRNILVGRPGRPMFLQGYFGTLNTLKSNKTRLRSGDGIMNQHQFRRLL
ncbi:hypothetical protein EYC80_001777 [Monilinia laxa]|uniref:Uncharacterized protein n=1 Tax=Monilinia laxa TaxID=61186 RepID=A0A5N6K5Y8_MONLA|nr:hypothetical protein EYC80_001777 [Monilinia laxa]